jgi:DNA-binding XRE family transcriptional regulator
MNNRIVQTIAKNLRHRRVAGRFSKVQLAELAGVSRQLIYLMERGTHEPKIGTLTSLANALECSVEDLIYPAH